MLVRVHMTTGLINLSNSSWGVTGDLPPCCDRGTCDPSHHAQMSPHHSIFLRGSPCSCCFSLPLGFPYVSCQALCNQDLFHLVPVSPSSKAQLAFQTAHRLLPQLGISLPLNVLAQGFMLLVQLPHRMTTWIVSAHMPG